MISIKVLRRVSFIFLVTGIFLIPIFLFEFLFGAFFKSYILLADSYHALIDSLISFLFYFTLLKINTKSKRFPWGLYNLESLVVLTASIFVAYLSVNLVVDMFKAPTISDIPIWYSIILFVSSAYSFMIYVIERRYRYISVVRNDMNHSLLDSATEIISGIGLIVQSSLFTNLITIGIVLFTFSDIINQLKDTILSILGASYDSPLKFKLLNELRAKNISVVNLYLRKLGSFYAVYAYIALPKDITLGKAYRIKKKAKRIISKYDNIVLVDIKLIPLAEKKKKKILNQVNTFYSR
ncbi:cation transporter [Sulfolobus tengchongensis]|uniref:Cation transporter n=1 Tax=Sulfolobus tengchongensis TaxID=207809 RepID=A0AAX4L3E3_9CREN